MVALTASDSANRCRITGPTRPRVFRTHQCPCQMNCIAPPVQAGKPMPKMEPMLASCTLVSTFHSGAASCLNRLAVEQAVFQVGDGPDGIGLFEQAGLSWGHRYFLAPGSVGYS